MLLSYNKLSSEVKPLLATGSPTTDLQCLDALFRYAYVQTESVKRIARVALATAGVGGEITAEQLVRFTGYHRNTVDRACRRLVGLGVLAPIPQPSRGRGHKTAFTVTLGRRQKSRNKSRVSRHAHAESRIRPDRNLKNPHSLGLSEYKDLNKTQSKDTPVTGASRGIQSSREKTSIREKPSLREKAKYQGQSQDRSSLPKRDTSHYQGLEAERVKLCIGARFYRYVMRSIRLGLEEWALSESVRDALEGFYGNRIDGASLSYARELKEKIWAMRTEIERLAASGASPRRICSFVAGKLAGVPEKRSRREILRRTAQLLTDVEHLEHRITGLRTWLKEREAEYREGRVCARCGYVHSASEFRSGYRDDGAGLVCFGFARLKLEELQETVKLRRRRECCRVCGGSLRGGHISGVCWACHDRDQAQGLIACRPALVGELVAATLEKISG